MNLQEIMKNYEEEMIAYRRHFHMYPERSLEEKETMNYIEQRLTDWGIEVHRVEPGGLIGVLEHGDPTYTVALRADMDALPIEESDSNGKQKKVCQSKRPGISHACGHDGHMAMLLTAAHILKDYQKEWQGRILFLFEQAEEVASPAMKNLLTYIDKQGWSVQTCTGTHLRWDMPSGTIGLIPGGAMAGLWGFTIAIHGHGGHGSRPDLAQSPIECFADIATRLQGLRLQKIEPQECLTYSLGSVHSGTKPNIIPETLTFQGTARYFDTDRIGTPFKKRLAQLIDATCQWHGCTWELEKESFLLEVRNDTTCTAIMAKVVEEQLGQQALYQPEPWMGSETVAAMLAHYGGVYFFTGIANPVLGTGANHHTPEFDLDEKGLTTGAVAMVAYTLHMLNERPVLNQERKPIDVLF